MKRRRYRSRPFLTWRGFVLGGAITAAALAAGWMASRLLQGVGT